MRKLIFYKSREDVPSNAACLTGKHFLDNLYRFERGEILELYIPYQFATGWRTSLTSDDCEIEFKGSFTTAEEAQCRNRLSMFQKTTANPWS